MAKSNLQFKTNYAVSSTIEPFYKGGKVQISKDEKFIFCTCGTRVNVLQIVTGKIVHSIEQDDQEDITSFALSLDDEILVTASKALLLKQWDWKQAQCTRSWRAIHNVPVASMTFDPTSTLLATGGCDGTIKLWDVVKQYCTHNLKGSSGVVHLVEFHPDISLLQLFSSASDCGIRMWDLRSSQCLCVLQSHYSPVTSLAFTSDGASMVSSGRDKICTVWDLKSRTARRTVPVYEAVESVVLLPEDEDFSEIGVKTKEIHFITAGSKGVLRVWDASSACCVFAQTLPSAPPAGGSEEGGQEYGDPRSLTYCLPLPSSLRLATVTAEHNILLYQLPSFTAQQQFVGFNDEVLDVKFLGKGDTHIVVATNSSQLKVFDLATSSCKILYGHTDTVLSLDVFKKGSLFVSCAKDKSVRVWRQDPDSGQVCCVAQGCSHGNAVGSITCSRMKESFVVSGSQDCTIKVWDLPETIPETDGDMFQLTARVTEKAHDKDVNSVAVSPNDKLLVSGSQDRLAKLWSLGAPGADLALLGVFRGHRRGVWCVQFSPMDQVLASSSADGSVKLWSLQDFSCLKTFEGHDASVLKLIFVSRGTQLLTSGSDGLVKLWTIKTNECVKTLDAHQDKVWGLHATRKDDRVVTASADSNITVWTDVTEVEQAEEQAKQEDQILKKQGRVRSRESFSGSKCRSGGVERKVKCVLVGDGAVGKTSLIVSYTTNGYPTEYVPTAFDNFAAVVAVDGKPVKLQLCDTAGQDEFDKLRPLCYTNADIFLLCFSVVSPSSFQNVTEKWVPEIRQHCPQAPVVLVGTQSDLREDVKVLIELAKYKERPVEPQEAQQCAEDMRAVSYMECSSLTQKNLKEVFDAAIVASIQHSDSQQQHRLKKRTPDKMKKLSRSCWKKYCCVA